MYLKLENLTSLLLLEQANEMSLNLHVPVVSQATYMTGDVIPAYSSRYT